MNQECKLINAHLERKGKKDFLFFEFDNPISVCLTDDSGQTDLKNVFIKILDMMTEGLIQVEYQENPEYKTGLYIDVCSEYLKDLNREIMAAYKRMPVQLSVSGKTKK